MAAALSQTILRVRGGMLVHQGTWVRKTLLEPAPPAMGWYLTSGDAR